MYYIGLDVHKKTISYCVKDASGQAWKARSFSAPTWRDNRQTVLWGLRGSCH